MHWRLRTSVGRHAPHAMVEIVPHKDIAGCVRRNTDGNIEGGRGARAIGKGLSAAASQGGHHCTTKDREARAEGEEGRGAQSNAK